MCLHVFAIFQLSRSGKSSVYLKSIDLNTGGLYRCEVSAEAPEFKTAEMEKEIKVYGKGKWMETYSSLSHPYLFPPHPSKASIPFVVDLSLSLSVFSVTLLGDGDGCFIKETTQASAKN